jgi:GT2 family glycosyltransferase
VTRSPAGSSVGRISVCIATHERAALLVRALEGLAQQERPADEIIVSDSSTTDETHAVVRAWQARASSRILYVRSSNAALPWNRWLAFSKSSGDVVLFLDDDVALEPSALRVLVETYEPEGTAQQQRAGVGFLMTWDDGSQPARDLRKFKERWLGTRRVASGTLTPGGIPVSSAGLPGTGPARVDHFWGGAMSFRRGALETLGPLDNLVSLYEAGIGRAEDIVLSVLAGRFGPLYLIRQPLARHPRREGTAATPYPRIGWRLGLAHTWGRAQTMRWTASDPSAYRRDVIRVVMLEALRATYSVLRHPFHVSAWSRAAGAAAGTALTTFRWHAIPNSPRSQRRSDPLSPPGSLELTAR